MRLFKRKARGQTPEPLPHLRIDVVHLEGPGTLRWRSDHLVYESDAAKQLRLDTEGLRTIIAHGELHLTTAAMRRLGELGIAVSWLNRGGTRLAGRLDHPGTDRTLTRLLQYRAWEDPQWRLLTARGLVVDEIESTIVAIEHYRRQGKNVDGRPVELLKGVASTARSASTVEALRGVEGRAAALWFGDFGKLLRRDWSFSGRRRRPPPDAINSLLSLGYMQLYHRVAARESASGLEVALGALHEFRPSRMSLASDVMEPLRIPVVNRWVVAITG